MSHLFSAPTSMVYRRLSRQKALALCGHLPRVGYETRVEIDGHEYWLANESGDYYFKHPDYEVKR